MVRGGQERGEPQGAPARLARERRQHDRPEPPTAGFSADWLALREPADLRARERSLADRLRRRFAAYPSLRVIDLGCGTGSNLRAVAPWLGRQQAWRLVDHDPALLREAARRLSSWADRAEGGFERLTLYKGDRQI